MMWQQSIIITIIIIIQQGTRCKWSWYRTKGEKPKKLLKVKNEKLDRGKSGNKVKENWLSGRGGGGSGKIAIG